MRTEASARRNTANHCPRHLPPPATDAAAAAGAERGNPLRRAAGRAPAPGVRVCVGRGEGAASSELAPRRARSLPFSTRRAARASGAMCGWGAELRRACVGGRF